MKILIIKPSSLGDVIHALPFLKAVKDTFRNARVDWVIGRDLKGILEGNPLIERLIVFDKDSWKDPGNFSGTIREVFSLKKALKTAHYDMVVDLQGLLRSGLMTFFTHAPLKIGFQNAREGSWLFYNRKISSAGAVHAVDKILEIAKSIGAKTSDVGFPLYIDNADRERVRDLTGNLREYVVIVPSARWETKKWPAENFGMLISRLTMPCVLTGGDSDLPVIQQVMGCSGGRGINLCGKTDLRELLALIAGARAVVSNDSGPMHIGAALDVPVVALFGPTDPERTGPYGWSGGRSGMINKKLKVLRSPMPCSPCFKRRCRDPLCMSGISVEKVLDELKEFL
ncbi:MAG: lipopolysaccharide heptosyltransferase II [Nitrospirae bacterium]|nr:lipopolysaccharide heptosyltransferase II [Nitrospirota bacterium]